MLDKTKEYLRIIKEIVPLRWSNDCGIGTANGDCCILGAVSIAEGLGVQGSSIGYGSTGLLQYPDPLDPIVEALAATIPQEFIDGYNEEMRLTEADDPAFKWTNFNDLNNHDKVVTYNDEPGRELIEIEEWVERAEKWLEEQS